MELCSLPYDYVDEKPARRELREVMLTDLKDYVMARKVLNERSYPVALRMIRKVLFRTLPPSRRNGNDSDDDDDDDEDGEDGAPAAAVDKAEEAAWPHRVLVYQFGIRLFSSRDVPSDVADRHVSRLFISNLVELFQTELASEREMLVKMMRNLWNKMPRRQEAIISVIQHALQSCVYETPWEVHCGLTDLLSFVNTVAADFATEPTLEPAHRRLLIRSIMPLHSLGYVRRCHDALRECVVIFVEKDPSLSSEVLRVLLRLWPATSTAKEEMFLEEVRALPCRRPTPRRTSTPLIPPPTDLER